MKKIILFALLLINIILRLNAKECINYNLNEEYDPIEGEDNLNQGVKFIKFMKEFDDLTVGNEPVNCRNNDVLMKFNNCIVTERFNLYNKYQPDITNCKNCEVYQSVEEFKVCMGDVRDKMINYLTETIKENVMECRKELENC